jgi:hypothetical protein
MKDHDQKKNIIPLAWRANEIYIYNMLLRDGGETAAAGRGKERDIQTREAQ